MTNPFIPLDPPGDTTNRTAKMLAGYRSTPIENGEPIPPNTTPGTQGSPTVWEHQFFGQFGEVANMGPHPVGEEDIECGAYIVDNSKGVYSFLQSHIITPGHANSELVCKYSPTLSLGDMGDFAKLSMKTADLVVPRVGIPALTPEDSRVKKLLLKLIRRGGNGVLTPEMWNAIISATSGTPPTVPTGTSDPLPQGEPWGNIIFDINANSTQMREMYNDGDDVNFWPDESGRGFDMSTTATLLLPKYRTTGFGGILPCVEWNGGNVHLIHPSTQPTHFYGSYTYYFVFDNVDGGDVAALWGGGFGDSFQYNINATADQYQCANNNLFGSPSIFVEAEEFMRDPHVLRWSKNSGSVSHALFYNGILGGTAGSNPQLNNQGFAQLMHHAGGLGLNARVARIVAYDRTHAQPTTPTGGWVTGKNPIEVILAETWGTP